MTQIEDLPEKYRKQAKEKLEAQQKTKTFRAHDIPDREKKSKYGNEKVKDGNLKFDSKKEYRRYLELFGMQEAGLISDLRLQHCFTLRESYTLPDTGERVKGTVYKADFTYYDSAGNFVIEDVKSNATKNNSLYRLKKKLMLDKGFRIKEV